MQVPWMTNKIHQKRYLKEYQDVTWRDGDGYPQYHRNNNGRNFNIGNYIINS